MLNGQFHVTGIQCGPVWSMSLYLCSIYYYMVTVNYVDHTVFTACLYLILTQSTLRNEESTFVQEYIATTMFQCVDQPLLFPQHERATAHDQCRWRSHCQTYYAGIAFKIYCHCLDCRLGDLPLLSLCLLTQDWSGMLTGFYLGFWVWGEAFDESPSKGLGVLLLSNI